MLRAVGGDDEGGGQFDIDCTYFAHNPSFLAEPDRFSPLRIWDRQFGNPRRVMVWQDSDAGQERGNR